MNILESVNTCLSKYFIFTGVATRSEYWWFQLFYQMMIIIGVVLDGNSINYLENDTGFWELSLTLLFIMPTLSVGVRRLHDIGKSGWWYLLAITIIGLLPLMYWACKEGGVSSKYSNA